MAVPNSVPGCAAFIFSSVICEEETIFVFFHNELPNRGL